MVNMSDEETLEKAALEWFEELGYETAYGPDMSPGGDRPERDSYSQVLLLRRLRQALRRINPTLPEEAIEEAIHRLVNIAKPTLEATNREFHIMLRDNVRVQVEKEKGERVGEIVKLFDFEDLDNNDWLVANQFTVVGERKRIPDMVVFVNGIPVGVIELKDPADIRATLMRAYNKIQNYKKDIPSLFYYNEIIVLSDGNDAKCGTITSPWERFSSWKTIRGDKPPEDMPPLEVAVKGVFDKNVLLELIRDFISFESDGARWIKKLAMYQQRDAVKIAVDATLETVKSKDKRIGVVWHAQGAGKSLTMVFYVAKLLRIPELSNPTIVVLTDRNDLDQQIYENFSAARDLIPFPKQAETVAHLKKLLKRPAGGIIFSTVQKFEPEKGKKFPTLSTRENIIVIADEAHRSHYNFIKGYARYIREGLPNAAFLGFTGTPIELGDRSTIQVFGDYIHVYDLSKAEKDDAIVPIIYENAYIRLGLASHAKEFLDEKFEEITEREEVEVKEKLKTKWAKLEKVVGSKRVLTTVAKDIIEHFENRLQAIEGKALVTCMSRRICVELYNHVIKLCPEWHDEDDKKGAIKVIMTGSSDDPPEWQPHIRVKTRMEEIKKRFVNPDDPLKIVIVRDMWLTGFDNPCLHTMYVFKPMKGHTLIQSIARVNRVYKDKPSGLVADYIGIGEALKVAVAQYTIRADISNAMISVEETLPIMNEKYEKVKSFLVGIDYSNWKELSPSEQIRLSQKALNEIVKDDKTKRGFLKAVAELNEAFVLVAPHPEALKLADDLAFFQIIRGRIVKTSPAHVIPAPRVETALKQLVSQAVVVKDIVDLISEKEVEHPEISILSEEFLKEVSKMEFPNLRIEMLRKLVNDEIRIRLSKNIVRYRSFRERLERTITAYHNRALESAKVIEELIKIAKELKESLKVGEELGLSEEELAFYDALSQGKEFVMSNTELKKLVRELVKSMKRSLSIDWTEHENIKSKIRVVVKRTLRKHGLSPVKYLSTVSLIMKQAEVLYRDWPTLEFALVRESYAFDGATFSQF